MNDLAAAESQFVLNHPVVPRLGRARDVDVRRLHHAGVGVRPHQERVPHLPQEHRPVRDRRTGLLPRRLQPDVRRRRRVDRIDLLPLRPVRRRSGARSGRRERAGRRDRQRLRGDVRLVLPDGVRGDGRLHRVRRPGGTGPAVVVLPVHAGPDRLHLPGRRRLDVGRRLAGLARLPGFCGVDHRARHGRLGGARGRARRRAAPGQVPVRRDGPHDAAVQRSGGDARRLHPLVRMVRASTAARSSRWGARPTSSP